MLALVNKNYVNDTILAHTFKELLEIVVEKRCRIFRDDDTRACIINTIKRVQRDIQNFKQFQGFVPVETTSEWSLHVNMSEKTVGENLDDLVQQMGFKDTAKVTFSVERV